MPVTTGLPRVYCLGARVPLSDYVMRTFRIADEPNRGRVLEAVRSAGFTVENIQEERMAPEKWGLILKPNRRLSDLFRLDREVLLWCSTFPRFQARDIEDIKVVIDKYPVRLSRSFAILVTLYDPQTRSELEAESAMDTTIVHCSIAELSRATAHGGRSPLERILLERLYRRDLYDLPSAATRAADFFGRRKTVDDMSDELVTGQSQIGVFGLRKIGKTSLTSRVIEAVTNSGRCIVAKLDLQWTTSIDPRPEYTIWALGEAIAASGRIVKNIKGLRLFGRYPTASAAEASGSIWEEFAHDLTLILRSTSRRIVIAIDEIERQYELRAGGGFVRFWRVLRGFDQQFPGRLRFLVSGTSPDCAECATIGNHDNPLYRYLSVRYLGPLDDGDGRDLLVNLGAPTGLAWSADALDFAVQQTGGHPALLRTMGSIVHSTLSPRDRSMSVTRDVAVSVARQIVTAQSAVLAQVTASLEDQFPDEFVMLEMLARGQISNFRHLAREYPNEMSHLIGYGLLPDGEPSEHLSIGLLQSYIQLREEGPKRAMPGRSVVQIGENVGRWKIVAQLKSGGFADVLVAEDDAGEKVAVKAFHSAQLSALEREVEYLQSLTHGGIVRFIEATKALSGPPCLVMEYLDGSTLADCCNATSAPSTNELIEIGNAILDALTHMHPDSALASALSAKAELSAHEFETWERSRHGVVHRDIKPENVMLTSRGPVLIDFNIAVRAADPVHTISATPGYLPADFNGIAWTPDIDIFQLGVTLVQLAAGARYDGSNLADLQTLAGRRHGIAIEQWLRSLAADNNRPTAAEARQELRKIRPV